MANLSQSILFAALVLAGCARAEDRSDPARIPSAGAARDSIARVREFTTVIASLVLDTTRFELRGTLAVKRVNPNRDDESPLVDQFIQAGAPPGPHTYEGTFYADLGELRGILDPAGKTKHDVREDRVYVGSPEVLILGHRHGDALFVPAKLYARQFGAFVDVRAALGTMAIIWTPEILRYSKRIGLVQSAGLIEGYAEGLVESVDVRAKPGF